MMKIFGANNKTDWSPKEQSEARQELKEYLDQAFELSGEDFIDISINNPFMFHPGGCPMDSLGPYDLERLSTDDYRVTRGRVDTSLFKPTTKYQLPLAQDIARKKQISDIVLALDLDQIPPAQAERMLRELEAPMQYYAHKIKEGYDRMKQRIAEANQESQFKKINDKALADALKSVAQTVEIMDPKPSSFSQAMDNMSKGLTSVTSTFSAMTKAAASSGHSFETVANALQQLSSTFLSDEEFISKLGQELKKEDIKISIDGAKQNSDSVMALNLVMKATGWSEQKAREVLANEEAEETQIDESMTVYKPKKRSLNFDE